MKQVKINNIDTVSLQKKKTVKLKLIRVIGTGQQKMYRGWKLNGVQGDD